MTRIMQHRPVAVAAIRWASDDSGMLVFHTNVTSTRQTLSLLKTLFYCDVAASATMTPLCAVVKHHRPVR